MPYRHFVDDLDLAVGELRAGREVTIQFAHAIGDTLHVFSPDEMGEPDDGTPVSAEDYVERVRALCRQFGEQVTIRFYDHFEEVFDGASVQMFPEAQSLHLGSLDEVENLEAAFQLPNLKRLVLSCFWLKDKRILEHLNFDLLTHLTIDQTNTKALDLAPLEQAQSLKALYLAPHHKNIGALSALTNLEEFAFSSKKGLDLSFINGLENLRSLKFNLGGTESIADIALPKLEDIAFTMTRNLEELGDMQRFPALKRVFMQDQQQVERIRFGAENRALEHLWFYNCNALEELEGLNECARLKSLRWIFTDRDPATLSLPNSLTHLHVLSGKRGAEAKEKAAIKAMGYIPDDHDDAWFFYK